MTDSTPQGSDALEPETAAEPETAIEPETAAEALAPSRPGLRTFSLEGRRAPGLYLVGWLASVLGGATLLVAIVSGAGGFGGLVLTLGGSLILGVGLIAAAGAQAIERRDRSDLGYRGPSPFLVFGASVPLTIVATLPLILLRLDAAAPLATLLSVLATDLIWVLLIGLTVVGTGALRWREIGAGLVGAPGVRIGADVLLGVLAALPVLLATGVVSGLLIRIVGVAPEGPLPTPSDATGLVVNLIAAAVVAPVGEEIFYRGFATTAWARTVGPIAAIVRGGLFFAAVHVLTLSGADFGHAAPAALVAFIVRIPVGLALGSIFVRRGSLPAAIALHATFNGALVLIAAAVGS